MTDQDDVLTVNLEFYRAFTARDFAAMDRLWAGIAGRLSPSRLDRADRSPLGNGELGGDFRRPRRAAHRLF